MRLILFILLLAPFIGSGQFIFGNKVRTNPRSFQNQNNITITGQAISNPNGISDGFFNNCLTFFNCNTITISNCYFGVSMHKAISMTQCTNIIIDNCFFANTETGFNLDNCTNITITNNQGLDVHGDPTLFIPGANFVQINNCHPPCMIRGNRFMAVNGESNTEDLINTFQSQGISGNPMRIRANVLYGEGGNSISAVSIQTGDGASSFIFSDSNYVYFSAVGGMSISGGQNNTMNANTIYNDQAYDPNANGMYVCNFSTGTCATHTVNNNLVRCIRPNLFSSGFFNCGDCGTVTTVGNNFNAAANLFTLPYQYNIFNIATDTVWQLRDSSTHWTTYFSIARPVASAGANQNITNTTTTLSAAGSTYSGTIQGYIWAQVSGPNTATMSDTVSQVITLTNLVNGTYRFRVVVQGQNRTSDAEWVNVTVAAVPPPTVLEIRGVKLN